MMRIRFTEQMESLNNRLIEMGALIETAIALATQALRGQDIALARKAIDLEREIDNKEKDIEALCLKLLLQQQPVARDLLTISAALKMITDMERIGDHAEDISELCILLSDDEYIKKLEHIPRMAEAAIKI